MSRWQFVVTLDVDDAGMRDFNAQQDAEGVPSLPDPRHWSLVDMWWADDAALIHHVDVVDAHALIPAEPVDAEAAGPMGTGAE